MIADRVERLEHKPLDEQVLLPSRTSWNKKNPTRELPYFVRDEYQIRTGASELRMTHRGLATPRIRR